MEDIQYLIHLEDRTKRAEFDMKGNLTKLDNISQLLQSISLYDSLSNSTSANDHSSHDTSPRDPHHLYDREEASKLKADLEYVSKKLEQTRIDIKEARTEVRLLLKLRGSFRADKESTGRVSDQPEKRGYSYVLYERLCSFGIRYCAFNHPHRLPYHQR